jgi:hypothetical protein
MFTEHISKEVSTRDKLQKIVEFHLFLPFVG